MELTTADRLELHELMGRYGDAIDDRAWDRLAQVFTPDAVFDLPHLDVTLVGLDHIVDYMDTVAPHPLAHMMTNLHVDADDHGVRLNTRAFFPVPTEGGGRGNRIVFGSYHDDVVRTDAGWRVTHRMFTLDRIAKRGAPCDRPDSALPIPPDTDFSTLPGIVDHIEQYRTDPDAAHDYDTTAYGVPGTRPALLLTTTGRRSGEPRPAPLIYGPHGDSFVVIASKGGLPDHPQWYRNLQADPDCTVQVGSRVVQATARVAEGTERARLWQQMSRMFPPYLAYQRGTPRVIPVVVLDPVADSAS